MKLFASLLVLASASILAQPAHALVRELANCSTADGQYTVSIQDNQGIGLVRSSNVTATVQDLSGKVVASYAAQEFHGIQSVSFGRPKYEDSATSGEDFLLQGPSTNAKNYILNVKLNTAGGTAVVMDTNLSCGIFGGAILK